MGGVNFLIVRTIHNKFLEENVEPRNFFKLSIASAEHYSCLCHSSGYKDNKVCSLQNITEENKILSNKEGTESRNHSQTWRLLFLTRI